MTEVLDGETETPIEVRLMLKRRKRSCDARDLVRLFRPVEPRSRRKVVQRRPAISAKAQPLQHAQVERTEVDANQELRRIGQQSRGQTEHDREQPRYLRIRAQVAHARPFLRDRVQNDGSSGG